MYFSLITPAPGAEREAAMQWAKGPYEQHQWLWQFLAAERGTERDFLFLRRDVEDKTPGFYVISAREPKSISMAWQVQSKLYQPELSVGQHLAFQLRANPVITHKVDGKSRRDDVVMNKKKQLLQERGFKQWAEWNDNDPEKPMLNQLIQEASIEWIERRAERCGFRLLRDADDVPRVRADGYMQRRADKKGIRFSTVDYSGALVITDTELFQKTLYEGVGHAKAFGCGLLMIKPI